MFLEYRFSFSRCSIVLTIDSSGHFKLFKKVLAYADRGKISWKGNLDLRESGEHTHFHSYKNRQEAGHYHCDVTPDEIEYECYFNTANEIYRVNNIYKESLSK